MYARQTFFGFGAVLAIALVAVVNFGRGEVSGNPLDTSATTFPPTLPEPTIYPPVTPHPGDEHPPRNPFKPYATGSLAPWQYADLTPAEQAVVDHGLDTASFDAVHTAFDAATRQQALAVAQQAAGVSLGVPDLEAIGVVP